MEEKQVIVEMCSICYESRQRGASEGDRLRPKQICYDCWFQHISNVVGRMSYRAGDDVLSPFNDMGPMDVIYCLNTLTPHHSEQIQEKLYLKYTSFTLDVEKCPSEECDFVYIGEKCGWSSNVYECPKCDTSLVPIQPYSLKSVLASVYLLLANKCPKCHIPIERISGCPHMTCPCGHEFCWFCYKDQSYGRAYRLYTQHNIPECSFIFLSKILLFCACVLTIIITLSGNQSIRQMQGMMGTIWSIVWRSVLMDAWIGVHVLMIVLQGRNRHRRLTSNFRLYLCLGFINFFLLPAFLYYLQQLSFCLHILLGEAILIACVALTLYLIIHSCQTWFQFIA